MKAKIPFTSSISVYASALSRCGHLINGVFIGPMIPAHTMMDGGNFSDST